MRIKKTAIALALLSLILTACVSSNKTNTGRRTTRSPATPTATPVDTAAIGWTAFTNNEYICADDDTSCPQSSSYAMHGMGPLVMQYAYNSYVQCVTASSTGYDLGNTGELYATLSASTKSTILNRIASCCSSQNGLMHMDGGNHYHDPGPDSGSLDQLKVGEAIANLINREIYNHRCNE